MLSYSASPLQKCDVVTAAVDADIASTTISVSAYVACNSSDTQMVARTQYTYSLSHLFPDDHFHSPAHEVFPAADARAALQMTYISSAYVAISPIHVLN